MIRSNNKINMTMHAEVYKLGKHSYMTVLLADLQRILLEKISIQCGFAMVDHTHYVFVLSTQNAAFLQMGCLVSMIININISFPSLYFGRMRKV